MSSLFQCQLDGATWSGCSNPKGLAGLASGQHLFAVRAVSRKGVSDPSPASRTFSVDLSQPAPPPTDTTPSSTDTTPPETTITSGPSGTISTDSTSFSFASSEPPSSFQCRLDGAAWASCSSPKAVTNLANGPHTFEIRATDGAGNTDLSPASRSLAVQVPVPPNGESCTFGTFSAGSPPGACWRPYSDSSPFNRTVPAAPRLAANSTAMVGRVLGFGQAANMVGGVADTPDDWGQPIYYSQPSDPVYTVHCTRAWGTCEVEGMQVRIPSAARPAGGGDGHMAVVDQQNGWEYDFWQVQSKPAGGGTISISWGGRTAIGTATADGLGSNATAAHFGILAGLIRLPELESMQINHALAMVVKCTNGTSVWPAESGTGTSCSSIGLSNADAPAMGQHFYLAMSDSEINALAVPQWKKAILFALARYGAFVRDTGGGSWGFSGESGSSYTSFGRVDPWRRVGDMPGVYLNGSDRVLDIRGGVDWSRLRAVDPCVAQGTC
jgi:hypothetical protein